MAKKSDNNAELPIQARLRPSDDAAPPDAAVPAFVLAPADMDTP